MLRPPAPCPASAPQPFTCERLRTHVLTAQRTSLSVRPGAGNSPVYCALVIAKLSVTTYDVSFARLRCKRAGLDPVDHVPRPAGGPKSARFTRSPARTGVVRPPRISTGFLRLALVEPGEKGCPQQRGEGRIFEQRSAESEAQRRRGYRAPLPRHHLRAGRRAPAGLTTRPDSNFRISRRAIGEDHGRGAGRPASVSAGTTGVVGPHDLVPGLRRALGDAHGQDGGRPVRGRNRPSIPPSSRVRLSVRCVRKRSARPLLVQPRNRAARRGRRSIR